jgi:endonuclease/exonuclease/phosphatase (EEP) superfamily protein YafD
MSKPLTSFLYPSRPGALSYAGNKVATLVGGSCWLYFAAVLVLWLLLNMTGDRWWPATLLLFAPRWVWTLPLVILVPAATVVSRHHLWILLNAGAVIVGPIMGFCVPWGRSAARADDILTLRVLTCNGGGPGIRGDDLITLVKQARPDIIVLQEQRRMPSHPNFWRDWQVQARGGVCLASRFPIQNVKTLEGEALGGDGMAVHYEMATPAHDIDFFGLHLETPRDGLEAVIYGKWRGIPDLKANIALRTAESEAASRWISRSRRPLLIAGDFNLPVDSFIYQRSWSWLTNAFSQAGTGFGYTKFTRWHGMRIDHILGGPGWRCLDCWVGPDLGSDHRPLIADMVFDPTS